MVDQVGTAIAKADGINFESDPARYRRLALAALGPLVQPTGAMVDAAHKAVWFDAFWATNSRADFRRPCVRCSSGRGALGITTPRREVNKPAFYFRAVLLQPCQEFSRCFVRVLVDGMNFVASLKVGYVVS
jgi:hypothetical protein